MNILALVNFYLPGCKGGGPIQSVANMVSLLGEGFDFKVITTDRDHRDAAPYPNITSGEWQQVGRARVLYIAPDTLSLPKLHRVLNETDYDVLYLNSLFHPQFTIRPLLLRWIKMIPRTPVVVAPRGELSPGALAIKSLKKRLYLSAVGACGLYGDVLWHASTSYEEADIRRWFGSHAVVGQAPIIVAPDLVPVRSSAHQNSPRSAKQPGCLRLIFLSRISPKKNLDGALKCLDGLRGAVEFDIYGHVDSEAYWEECQQIIAKLPPNITVSYRGAVPHDEALNELARRDLLFLPTHGENFGHVIVESLWAGCPILISDKTPWRNLEAAGVGWDLPVSPLSGFQKVLQRCVDMGDQEHRILRVQSRKMAENVARNESSLVRNRNLFVRALERADAS